MSLKTKIAVVFIVGLVGAADAAPGCDGGTCASESQPTVEDASTMIQFRKIRALNAVKASEEATADKSDRKFHRGHINTHQGKPCAAIGEWASQYGDCSTYAKGKANGNFCADMGSGANNNVAADAGCTECGCVAAPQAYCKEGVKSGSLCCPASCGTCGGAQCGKRPGGSDCCGGALKKKGDVCATDEQVACIIPAKVNAGLAPAPAPTSAPAPAPTPGGLPACVGDHDTWNPGWGTCVEYVQGGSAGYGNCAGDGADAVCHECDKCQGEGEPGSTIAPTPAPTQPAGTVTELHIKVKTPSGPQWNTGSATGGIYGWSYYLRAFNLLQDAPLTQFGWGQWTSPGWSGSQLANKSICSVHPHHCERCDSPNSGVWQQEYHKWKHPNADMQLIKQGQNVACKDSPVDLKTKTGYDVSSGQDKSLEGCGGTNYKDLEKCQVCKEDPMPFTMEGGMGYWPYMTEDTNVGWMMPASTASGYSMKEGAGSLSVVDINSCTEYGGAVRIANRIVLPSEALNFEGGDDKGFLGYMVAKTPVGKRGEDDDSNYWTVIVDAENFAGPLVYVSTWFWDARSMWHPNSVSWSDPRSRIGYIAQGFEGSISGRSDMMGGDRIWKTNGWGMPLDKEDTPGMPGRGTTLFTGHKEYLSDWLTETLEPFLDGSVTDVLGKAGEINAAGNKAGTVPQCFNHENQDNEVTLDDQDYAGHSTGKYKGWGIGVTHGPAPTKSALKAAGCPSRLPVNTSHHTLDCKGDFCRAASTFMSSSSHSQIPASELEGKDELKKVLGSFDESPHRNDGRTMEPWNTEKPCFEKPGPATDTLYCTRTIKKTWIAWKWYRFVDQPDLSMTFAQITDDTERQKARCYMQARIERLHKTQEKGQRWFEPPQGDEALPAKKVEFDKSLIVTPPAGLEYGYVPIPIYNRLRMKPKDCLPENTMPGTQGAGTDEPEPHPDVHRRRRTKKDQRRRRYYTHESLQTNGLYPYDVEICRATGEEASPGSIVTAYGDIYPYPTEGSKVEKKPFKMPLRTAIGDLLDANPKMCDGTVLKKSITTTTTVCPSGDYPSDGGPNGMSESEWEDLVDGIKTNKMNCDGSPNWNSNDWR